MNRIDAVSNQEPGAAFTAGDYVLGILLLFSTTFTGIFFNSALVAAALERLRGGSPTASSGLKAALRRIDAIIGWAVVSTTIGVVLRILSSHDKIGRIISSLIGGVWAYITFFVVPIIVQEGTGPLQATGQSTGLIRATWSRQFTADFAFGIAYFLAFIVIALRGTVSPVLAIVVAVLLGGLAFATLSALQGIFTAALYRYTEGRPLPGSTSRLWPVHLRRSSLVFPMRRRRRVRRRRWYSRPL